jgi:hypothetical protein
VNLDNLKLGAKALLPIALMAAIVVAMIAFGGMKLNGVSAAASDIIERRTVGRLTIDRARISVVNLVYNVFSQLTFDSDDPSGNAAAARGSTRRPRCCRRRPTRSSASRRDFWR